MTRRRSAPQPHERVIQAQIVKFLEIRESAGALMFERTNVASVKTERGNYMATGRAGSSDIKIYLRDGRTLHLEVKRPKGRQNANQKAWQAELERLGHTYRIATSVEDVIDILADMAGKHVRTCAPSSAWENGGHA
jgi:hypothetical protein